jgi:hypothetical protein
MDSLNEKKEKRIMKTRTILINLGLITMMLLAGCSSEARVGSLRTESQSVELGEAESVHVEIDFGAGDLQVSGGAEKLMGADFTYNVARLKPEVTYKDSTLAIQQPDVEGFPALQGISGFRNEWDLRLDDGVPMDLRVNIGAGTSSLQLGGFSLTGLDVTLGAGISTIDLSGDWARDLNITIDSGAADLTIVLPGSVGVRVVVDRGATLIEASDLSKNENIYTNAAYGESEVTLELNLSTGIGVTILEVAPSAN